MPLADRLYRWLAQSSESGLDAALGEALAHAEPDWFEKIVQVLLGRDNESSWTALISRFELLPESARKQLFAQPARRQAAVAHALRSSDATTRQNALQAVELDPSAHLAYLLPDTLQDPMPHVRDAAARVFRSLAAQFADPRKEPSAGDEHVADRRRVASAVQEALSRFEVHHRLEVIEAALWYANEIGAPLWDALASHRVKAGQIVHDQLEHWASPRLAGFLLAALKHAQWHEMAVAALKRWHTPQELAGLLDRTVLLSDREIAAQIATVREPQWFSKAGKGLSEIPAALRPNAVRWVLGTALSEQQRLDLFAEWLEHGDRDLRCYTLFGLALLEHTDVPHALRRAVRLRNPLASYAHWMLMSLRGSVDALSGRARNAVDEQAAGEFAALGRICRRIPLPHNANHS